MPKGQPLPPNEDADNPLYKEDNFRMWCLKVLPCSKRYCHDWTTCPWAHAQEKAKRRDPRVYNYCAVACDAMKKTMSCPRGNQCPYAHNVFEYWLHHTRYRTQLCNDGVGCKRKICFFAHTLDELRVSNVKLPDGVRSSDAQGGANNNINPFAPSARVPAASALLLGARPKQQSSPEHMHHTHSGSLGGSSAHDVPLRSNSGLESLTGGSATPLSSAGRSSVVSAAAAAASQACGLTGLSLAELQQLGALQARVQAQQQLVAAAAAVYGGGGAGADQLSGLLSADALVQLVLLAQQQQQEGAPDPVLVQQIMAQMLLAGQQQQVVAAQVQQQMALLQLLGQQQQQTQHGAGGVAAGDAALAALAAHMVALQAGGDAAVALCAPHAASAMHAAALAPPPLKSGRFSAAPMQPQASLPLPTYSRGFSGPLSESGYDAAHIAMEELSRQLSLSALDNGEGLTAAAMGARLQLSPRHMPSGNASLADPMVPGAPFGGGGLGAIGSGSHSPPGSNRSSASAAVLGAPVGPLSSGVAGAEALVGGHPAVGYAPFGVTLGSGGGKAAPSLGFGGGTLPGAVGRPVMVPQHVSPASASALGGTTATTAAASFFSQHTHSLGSSRDGSDSLDILGPSGVLHV